MKISELELYRVSIPVKGTKPLHHHPTRHGKDGAWDRFYPNWIPGFPQRETKFYLLRLITDTGLEGIAGMPAIDTERDSFGPVFGAYLIGLDPLNPEEFNHRIQEFSYVGLRNGWIDAAFYDIMGKHQGKPLHQLLGGVGGTIKPYWSTGDNYDHDPAFAISLVKKARELGYRGIKLRVKSMDLEKMVAFVAAARGADADMEIMVDCNQGWPVSIVSKTPLWDVEFAKAFAKRLEPLRVSWIEEPLNRGNIQGLAELRKSTTTPIAAGELNASWVEFQSMLAAGSADIYQPDAVLAEGTYFGGITLAKKLVESIRQHNAHLPPGAKPVSYCPHTWTTGIGFMVNLQLLGLLTPEERHFIEFPLEGPWTPDSWGRMLKNRPWPNAKGEIEIPNLPGIGVDLDWSVIRKYGKRIHRSTKFTVAVRSVLDKGISVSREILKNRES